MILRLLFRQKHCLEAMPEYSTRTGIIPVLDFYCSVGGNVTVISVPMPSALSSRIFA